MSDYKEYRLELPLREIARTYCHEPSYLKAKEIFEKYPNAIWHCCWMMKRKNGKIKSYIERGYSIEDLEKQYMMWEKMLDKALEGKPSEFFIKLNNLPIKE